MLYWLATMALAGKWDGANPDVVVTQVVPASAEDIHPLFLDWKVWQDLLPIECASEWEILGDRTGIGARASALFTFGPMRRRLDGVITKDEPGRVVETELAGKKGWFTQVTYAPAEGGTEVTLTSPVARPKWPVTGIYFGRVKPAWVGCYAQALSRLGDRVVR
jgi:hypothetical protein